MTERENIISGNLFTRGWNFKR